MLNFVLSLDPATGSVRELPVSQFCDQPHIEGICWIDLEGTDREDVEWLARHFHFHPLSLEDCLKRGQRPKVDHYDGYAFLDVYTGAFNAAEGKLEMHEIDCFLCDGFIVTSHKEPIPAFQTVRERWSKAEGARKGGASYLFYVLLDTIVDDYFPMVDDLEELLEKFEESLFDRFEEQVISRIFSLKKELLLFRKIVAPTRDVCLMLLRRETELISPLTAVYLQDVYDHLIRVADSIDTYRDLVAGSIDAYLSVIANRTNDTMKRLTSISAVLMSVTLVAGIYGMNFQHIPELSWRYGYEYAIGLMVAIALVLSLVFKALRYF